MLFLQLPAEAAVQDSTLALPIEEATALALERAILATDRSACVAELRAALAADRNAANWALRTAEIHSGRTMNRLDEAANWLADNLAVELAAAIRADVGDTAASDISWRLPLVVAKIAAAERRIADFDRRLEHEKLESLKELAYGASHEINNPLANIAARAQTLLEDETEPERQRKLVAIHRQAMRAHEMIADLMLFARPPKLVRVASELNRLVIKVVDELRSLAAEKNIELRCEPAADPINVMIDATQISVAVSGIVKNSIEAVADGGHVQITTQVATDGDRKQAEIIVTDDGPGISDEVRRHMFDPFYSGREAGRGLGFGLSKCWRIVTDHGGQVVVARRTGGAEFCIQLPLANSSVSLHQ